MIKATASVELCRWLLGFQDGSVARRKVVCREVEDARAVTVTRQDAMQFGSRSAGGGLSLVSRRSLNQTIKCND